MSSLKRCLDNNPNKQIIINNPVMKNRRSMRNLVQSINIKYSKIISYN